jgi:adenylate cyclase
MNRVKWKLFFIVPLITVGLAAGLDYLGVFTPLQGMTYRLLTRFQDEVEASEQILQVVVDEDFQESYDMETPPRDLLAEGIILLREFGAEHLVLTEDFSRKSTPGINPDYLLDNLYLLDDRVTEEELAGLIRDRDIYLGEALAFFGSAYVSVLPADLPDPTAPEDLLRRAGEEHTFSKEIGTDAPIGKTEHLVLPVTPIAVSAAGFGIPGFDPDTEKPPRLLRHVDLFTGYRDGYLPQIAFLALFYRLGRPEIMLFEDRLVVLQAEIPEREVKDLLIPFGPDGGMLLYRVPDYDDSPFNRISFNRLMLHHKLEQDLLYTLRRMERLGFFEYGGAVGAAEASDGETTGGRSGGAQAAEEAGPAQEGPLGLYRAAEALKTELMRGESRGAVSPRYTDLRKRFFRMTGAFLKGEAEQEILAAHGKRAAEVEDLFSEGREIYNGLVELRKELFGTIDGTLCIYGRPGSAVETNATVANGILQEAFYDEFPWWYALAAAAVCAFLISFLMSRVKAYLGAILGLFSAVFVTAGFGAAFILTGIFIPVSAAGAALFLTYLVSLAVSVVAGAYRKRWIRMAYGRSFPPEAVKLAAAPSGADFLKGTSTPATGACFSFQHIHSAVSGLEPEEAVSLTSELLEQIRQCILTARGSAGLCSNESCTALFGVPIPSKESVSSACSAALFMEQKDAEINRLLTEKGIKGPAYRTEIGVHNGEIVVGNIGKGLQVNYTITGLGAVFLAKLATANRQYGTRIIVTEDTKKKAEGLFVFRKLDRVRAEENSLPVRIYELAGIEKKISGEISGETARLLHVFEEGRQLFEKRDWVAAHKRFIEALKIDKNDGPAELFARRCQKFAKNPPSMSWDGVFSLPN